MDETRYFDSVGSSYGGAPVAGIGWGYSSRSYWAGRVKVGDLASVTSLKTDPQGDGTFTDTWTLNTDFTLEPYNAVLDGRPYRYITRHPRGHFFLPPGYPRSIQVVGKFGWAVTPPQVIDATTILASRLFRRKREAPFGVVTVGIDVGAVARIARLDPDVMMLLSPFMEAPFA